MCTNLESDQPVNVGWVGLGSLWPKTEQQKRASNIKEERKERKEEKEKQREGEKETERERERERGERERREREERKRERERGADNCGGGWPTRSLCTTE